MRIQHCPQHKPNLLFAGQCVYMQAATAAVGNSRNVTLLVVELQPGRKQPDSIMPGAGRLSVDAACILHCIVHTVTKLIQYQQCYKLKISQLPQTTIVD